ncbi:hypothetical protein DMC30DRAFT_174701 [Rhodotorula diobovata]|uniref:MYND-type domain-containing protein n=1 Tax=Rhodotorula diobovata TaxID=5288 RepID=A0A5C5G0I2_9BASI|nr:hypothetical protein DMC30DRAFT_174701 [Rhodotorula diobovata]
MSNLKPGPCLVCGVETKNRCSNCAKTGLSNFFCSASHQKLVWYAHKHFCGPGKAHPFTWPLLSEDEAREIIANKASDVRDHCGGALVQCLPQYHPDDIDAHPRLHDARSQLPRRRTHLEVPGHVPLCRVHASGPRWPLPNPQPRDRRPAPHRRLLQPLRVLCPLPPRLVANSAPHPASARGAPRPVGEL